MNVLPATTPIARLTILNKPSLGLCLAVVATALGCGSESGGTLPEFTAETPEQKLEQAMQRLDEAIIEASAARGSGVVSQRKSSYQLIPPDEPGGQYRAEVTIETRLALSPTAVENSQPDTEPEKEAEKSPYDLEEGVDAQPIDDTADDEEVASDDEKEAEEEVRDATVTRRAIEQSREVKKQVYELAYKDDRWKVVSEFDQTDELGPLLFKYALDE
jgi:hypothetical protein